MNPIVGRIMFGLGLLVVTLPVPLAGRPAALPEAKRRLQAGEPLRIVCFGDSITGVYYHTGGRVSWVDVLATFLRARHPAAALSVRNAGVSGHTTVAALARMERDVLVHEPHLVAIMFGMNDAASVPPETFVRNLVALVDRARARGAEVVLLTPPHVQPGDPERPPERVAAYADLVREVARKTGVRWVDVHRRFAEEARAGGYRWTRLMSDTIHPNLHGHRLIAEELARAILDEPELAEIVVEPSAPVQPMRDRKGDDVFLKVFAMEPFDSVVGEALREVAPGRHATIVPWPVAGKSLAALIEDTRRRGRWRHSTGVDGERPDLVVLALPVPGEGATDEDCFRDYSALVNGSLSFGAPEWVLWVVLPSMADPVGAARIARSREIARDVLASKGLSKAIIAGDDVADLRRSMAGRLERWLR